MSKIADFTTELKALLEKYDATLSVEYSDCSDMHGVTQEGIDVSFGAWHKHETHKLTEYDWELEAEEL